MYYSRYTPENNRCKAPRCYGISKKEKSNFVETQLLKKGAMMYAFDPAILSKLFYLTLNFFQWILTTTGAIIIIRGGLRAARIFFNQCVFRGKTCLEDDQDEIRRALGLGIIIGLEFILAGDVIATLLLPDYYNLGLLAILVFIRTILNYFLEQELQMLRRKSS